MRGGAGPRAKVHTRRAHARRSRARARRRPSQARPPRDEKRRLNLRANSSSCGRAWLRDRQRRVADRCRAERVATRACSIVHDGHDSAREGHLRARDGRVSERKGPPSNNEASPLDKETLPAVTETQASVTQARSVVHEVLRWGAGARLRARQATGRRNGATRRCATHAAVTCVLARLDARFAHPRPPDTPGLAPHAFA